MDLATALSWLSQRDLFTGPFGLHRMEFLLERLDNPQNQYPAVLIGGTNGKGSVTVLLEHMFAATPDYQVGSTISPHLIDLTERVRLQCTSLPEPYWSEGIAALKDIVKIMERESSIGAPSFFELVTALAFLAFRESDRDLAFVEVGLGGRLDATNVCYPEVSVITNIGTDHREILGPDRPTIAREKLGILRRKRPLVTAERDPAILDLFRDACQKEKATLVVAHQKDHFRVVESTPYGHRLAMDGVSGEVNFPLPGLHQLDNLAIALTVVKLLAKNHFEVPPEAIARGIAQVAWPGRLQWLPGRPPLLVDGAHNPEGLASLLDYLDRFPMERPCHLVLGALQKKPFVELAGALAGRADSLAFVPPATPRAVTREEFAAHVAPLDPRWQWHDTLDSALAAGQQAKSILVTGSLYLAADLLRWHAAHGGV